MVHPPQWRRIYHQTLTLTYKNLLVFYKSPIVTLLRALILPVALTLIFCLLKNIKNPNDDDHYGISQDGALVMDLPVAISNAPSQRLVFALNGIRNNELNDTVKSIMADPKMKGFDTQLVDDPEMLFDVCKQSIYGSSDCFASVIFTAFDEARAEYIIAMDDDAVRNTPFNYRTQQSIFTERLLPLQWAIDSHIGNFASQQKPIVKTWGGYFSIPDIAMAPREQNYWLSLVSIFVAPLFTFILLCLTHHVSTFVAGEKQSAVTELMTAQGVSLTPRILSYLISFCILYCPGMIVSSILLGEILFPVTPTGLILILTLFATISFVTFSNFIGLMFTKAHLAGLCTSVLAFSVGIVTIEQTMRETRSPGLMTALSLIFPPYAWATLIRDVAAAESMKQSFPDERVRESQQGVQGNLFFVFFIFHIFFYIAGTFAVEYFLWRIPNVREWIADSDEVALRVGSLSKTYKGDKKAVKSLDFEVRKGSVTFLLGPNGSGKTTALKCISGMTKVDSGSSIQFSQDGYSFGLCPQNNVLWDALTVNEHISIWKRLKTAGNPVSVVKEEDVIAECDLAGKAHSAAGTLSGGQKRRLQLAIGFCGGSKVCCIDEASSGLDPLSRRNIWNIIQQGRQHRTAILTTHFLDEADVLADHIVIMCQGRLVCQGTSIALKTQYGDSYRISVNAGAQDDRGITWKAATSTEATKKVIELEQQGTDSACNITFPTLEQVFLRTTSQFNTTVQENGGDGIVGEENTGATDPPTVVEKDEAVEAEHQGGLDLDVGRSIGVLRQIAVLFRKRYLLLRQRSGWFVYGINLLTPIVVAAALSKFLYSWKPLPTCEGNFQRFMNPKGIEILPIENQRLPPFSGHPGAILGPGKEFQGPVQDELFAASLAWVYESNTQNPVEMAALAVGNRKFVPAQNSFADAMNNSQGLAGFGLYAPTPENSIFFHDVTPDLSGSRLSAFSLLTNRIANSTATQKARHLSTRMRLMRHVESHHDWRNLPISMLLVIALVGAVSTASIYPVYERISNVRALQYSNGVSPFALWVAYLLFDTQFIFVEGLIVWGTLFVNPVNSIWYRPDCIFGAVILFGIASYLGTYLMSSLFRRAGFALAFGAHALLLFLYFIAYVLNQFFTDADSRHDAYNQIHNSLGLIAPAANLARALFLGMNTFDVLCGKYGDADTSNPYAYVRYGGVYANFVYQIIFLAIALGAYEYGSAEWFRQLLWWRRARIPSSNDGDDIPGAYDMGDSILLVPPKTATATATPANKGSAPILQVDGVSKLFGRTYAAQNVTLSISANETLALLGGNGAGKTTVINMIRGEMKPDAGDIYVDGISVLRQTRNARLHIGVCPQDDAVDNLTVRQTLEFYAAVKGLKRIRENVDQVMTALDILRFGDVRARALSGGTRRKLTVAIALLGNPPLLLLDEPSTSQDAGAKRNLWRALKRVRANRAILLTTHSMEEAEALASNVAIMRTKLLASGTLISLNETYGGAYRLRGARCTTVGSDTARAAVRKVFAQLGLHAMNYADMNGIVQFFIKYDRRYLGRILYAMEEMKVGNISGGSESTGDVGLATSSSENGGQAKIFEDYTLTEPTLEELFMNVVTGY
ncbi:hypothetical protein BDV23DRAFT_181593 [Aspergillus alliaceus]|uniref:ABC transporter domain-containing protein n=1 Tax=Petromyces alliaceus TaxID=209559 RepID=A0A5N7CEW1_PETAA|nr:hypothetical protein BDV23DRAFT_181593 [Aspergillus alliaceus]